MLLDAAIESSHESCKARLGSQEQICLASAVHASSHPVDKHVSPTKSVVAIIRLAWRANGRGLSDVGTHVGRPAIIVCFTNLETKCIDVNIFERNSPNAAGPGWTRTKRTAEFCTVAVFPFRDAGCSVLYAIALRIGKTYLTDGLFFPASTAVRTKTSD